MRIAAQNQLKRFAPLILSIAEQVMPPLEKKKPKIARDSPKIEINERDVTMFLALATGSR